MNHFHRVIFNRSLGVRQVVSEIASSGRGAGSEGGTGSAARAPRLSLLAGACLVAWCAAPPQALAATCDADSSVAFVACANGAGTGDTINLTTDITLNANLNGIDKNLIIDNADHTLTVSADNNLGSTSGTLILNTGTLQNTANFITNRAITLNGNHGTFQTDADLTVAGVIDGTGALLKLGTGTLVLSAQNTYGFNTVIRGGVLSVSSSSNLGAFNNSVVISGATLQNTRPITTSRHILLANGTFQTDADLTLRGLIDGSTLNKQGAGTLILSGDNTYTGGTTIAAGTLQLGDGGTTGSIQGDVANNGTLAFTLTAANDISGAGTLSQQGSGTLILSGNNTYSGSTTVSAGTLQVGNGGTTGSLGTGAVTNNAALVFNRSGTLTAANDISGTGSLDKQGAGTLVLSGANTYTGGTTISAGTLQVGNGGATGSITGNVLNNAALVFNRSNAYTAANPISGTGTLTQAGAGNLILSGANTYGGATGVNAGTLSVNGSITSATTVNSGGTLGGNGTVGNVNVASGGTLAPGNSIGTLTVNGNLTFAPGSVYRVETDAAGNADRVNVVGAPGTLTINGGTVDVRAGAGNYARNTRYTILTSTGATTGTFTGVTSNLAFLTPSLSYLPNGVTLNLLAENAPSYSTVAQTPNQLSVANYLNSFANAPGSAAAAALIQQIDNLSAEQARTAFDSMSGSAHAAASQIAGAIGRNFSATLATRTGSTGLSNSGSSTAGLKAMKAPSYASLNTSLLTRPGDVVSDSPLRVAAADPSSEQQDRPTLQSVGGLWGQAMGTGGRTGSDGNGPASRYRANGFVLGYDQPISSNWLAGAALAYNKAQWDATTNAAAPASGRINTPQAGLYARYTAGPWQVRLDGTYSDHRFSTDRTVTVGNTSSIARSSHSGTEWAFAAQAEYSLPAGDWDVRPLAGLRHARLSEDGFTETGAGAASLNVDARRTQNTVASLGMKFIRPLDSSKADKGAIELRAIASHLMGDNDSPLSSRLAGQAASFTAAGTPLKRTALTLGGTLTAQLSRGLSAYADAAYEYRGAGQNAFQLTAGLRLNW